MTTKDLESYEFIKKDNDLQEILNEDMTNIEKQFRLEEKLKSLEVRKESNRVNWQF